MKTLKPILLLVLGVILTMTSCRTEEDLAIDPPTEETIEANSETATLLRSVATNDGSFDNIIDSASCISVQLPVTVTVNNVEITINDDDGYEEIEDIIDLFDDDVDSVVISYPITVVLADFSTVVVNSDSELSALAANCLDENEDDDDIECIDFQYPITASVYNQNNDLINSITINNDNDLYDFIDDLDEYAAVTIEFPLTVILADGTTQTVNNIQELIVVIEAADDSCDEDDDNDFDDDDCENCTTDLVSDILTECPNWYIDDLERNDNDLEDNYTGYFFTFNEDNTVTVSWDNGSQSENGTWSTSGSGNNITFVINIPGFDDINDSWNLHEVENDDDDEWEVELRIGDDDELEFKNSCSGNGNVDDSTLVSALTNGDWYITYFFDDTDETTDFADYIFNFAPNNTATATNMSGTINGSWSTTSGDDTELGLNLNFGTSIPLDELADDWDVLEVTNDILRLRDVSGGDGSENFLTFEREPFNCDNCTTPELNNILVDCSAWTVDKLERNDTDLEENYIGYEFEFNNNGTLLVNQGENTFNGTWESSGTGNGITVIINVTGLPDFNDTWNLNEIEQQPGEVKVDLRLGDDRLRFESNCTSDVGSSDIEVILSDGLWFVASYTEDANDQTSNYAGYELDFNTDGTVSASNGSNTNNGNWAVLSGGNQMALNFGMDLPFEEFNDDDWNVISVSSTEVVIQDVSGGGGGTDTLTLQKL